MAVSAQSPPLELPTSRPLRVLAGPALRNAALALLASGSVATLLRARVGETSTGAGLLAAGDGLRALTESWPVLAVAAFGAVSLLVTLVALYDATRSWALPATAADSAWWVAVGPWAMLAWADPTSATSLAAAGLVLGGLARDRYLPAALGAGWLTVAVPGGAVAALAVLVHFALERGWRQGLMSWAGALLAAVAPVATAAWQAAQGSGPVAAAVAAWWGAAPAVPAPPDTLSAASVAPLAGGALLLAVAGALFTRPRRAPVAVRVLAVTSIALAVLDAATHGRPGPWLLVVAAVPLVAALTEQRRMLSRVLWVLFPLLALLLAG